MKKNKQKLVFQSKVEFAEGKPPKEIQILPIGKWDHPRYGVISITTEDIAQFKENFDKKIRKDIPITQGHESFDEKPAVGWFTKVEDRGDDGLWGQVDWNETGKNALKQKAFKYFSPEFYQFYDDPETREEYKNVLVGGALTNKPYFKELKAVVFSDKDLINSSENNDMELKDLLKKDVAELTDEEKVFINEHKDELSDDEKTKVESVLEEETEEKEEEEEKTEEKEEEKEEEATEEKKEASEKTLVSAAELDVLKNNADKGVKAFAELEAMKITSSLNSLLFSESNSKGRILPKNEKAVRVFMETLNEEQRVEFSTIINAIPSASMFKEIGKVEANSNSAEAEVDTKVKALMSDNKDLTYSLAVNQLFSENKDLEKRYNLELSK